MKDYLILAGIIASMFFFGKKSNVAEIGKLSKKSYLDLAEKLRKSGYTEKQINDVVFALLEKDLQHEIWLNKNKK